MRVKSFLAVCIATGMALLQANQAQAAVSQSISLQFSNVASPISSDYIALFSTQSSTETFEGYAKLQNIPTGDSSQSFIISPTGSSQTNPAGIEAATPIDAVTFIGVYTNDSTQGITLGISSLGAALLSGQSYSTLGLLVSPSFPSESDLIAGLQNPDPSANSLLLSAVGTPLGADASSALIGLGSSGSLLSFSNGQITGALSVDVGPTIPTTAVPLPSSVWTGLSLLAGLGVLGIIRRSALPATR